MKQVRRPMGDNHEAKIDRASSTKSMIQTASEKSSKQLKRSRRYDKRRTDFWTTDRACQKQKVISGYAYVT